MWSNLAHEMTAEFRGLCAEEVERKLMRIIFWTSPYLDALYFYRAIVFLTCTFGNPGAQAYLQQELEKLHDLRNKVKLEGELWDELVSSSSQNSHLVQRATRLWDSLLVRKSKYKYYSSVVTLHYLNFL